MSEKPTQKGSVLLVDDDNFLLDMYSMKFTQQGYTVHASLSVREALETLKSGFTPDAVVFDLVMPENDGFSLLKELKDKRLVPTAVRIALTNQSQDADMTHAMELGADSFIVKASIIPSEVVNMVGSEIAKKRRA